MYCPECGADHHAAERTEREEAEKALDREVELARINAKRDIEVERIRAGAAEAIAESEAEHSAAHAEGVVEGVDATLEAVSGGGEPAPAPAPEPVVVDVQDDEPEPTDEMAPPPVEKESAPKETKRKQGFFR